MQKNKIKKIININEPLKNKIPTDSTKADKHCESDNEYDNLIKNKIIKNMILNHKKKKMHKV